MANQYGVIKMANSLNIILHQRVHEMLALVPNKDAEMLKDYSEKIVKEDWDIRKRIFFTEQAANLLKCGLETDEAFDLAIGFAIEKTKGI